MSSWAFLNEFLIKFYSNIEESTPDELLIRFQYLSFVWIGIRNKLGNVYMYIERDCEMLDEGD